MTGTFYLAWRYLTYHRYKTGILIASITLILYLPVGLRVLADQSSRQLTSRAEATPLLVGGLGSRLELVLSSLYFGGSNPDDTRYAESIRVKETGLADAIPLHVRFEARGFPIVGTTLDYLSFRKLRVVSGRRMAVLGECILGSRAARSLDVGPGDHVISSPESVFDIAGVYPLKMRVAGVLGFSDSPDDDAVFVDIKTAWIIQGLGHGHQDLDKPQASSAVLSRDENRITANASVVQYNEITAENIESFHFHGDLSTYPITAVLAIPHDEKASAILQGRYQSDDVRVQIVQPKSEMGELLDTILTVQGFIVAGAAVLGIATLATSALVFMLSLRLRQRERVTLFKIGGSRSSVFSLMASEITAVLISGVVFSALLTGITSRFGSIAVRALIRLWGS
jgi:putative ABC transport system permease protein